MNTQLTTGYDLIPLENERDYKFITKESIVYDAYFSPAPEFFEGTSVEHDVTMFTLEPEGGGKPSPKFDPRIAIATAKIFELHFQKDRKNIVAYICANSDKKEVKRASRFGRMFDQENIGGVFRRVEFEGNGVYGAVIYHKDNPAEGEIIKRAESIPYL